MNNPLPNYERRPKPTAEQCRLFQELKLPNGRVDIKKLFGDKKYTPLRRYLKTVWVMTTQAREDIDTQFDEVYKIVVATTGRFSANRLRWGKKH